MTEKRKKELVESSKFWSHLGFVLEEVIVSASGNRVAKVFDEITEKKSRFITTEPLDNIYRTISRRREDRISREGL